MHTDGDENDTHDERLRFPGGWKGLYRFVIIYGVVQVVLLYLFTFLFNRS